MPDLRTSYERWLDDEVARLLTPIPDGVIERALAGEQGLTDLDVDELIAAAHARGMRAEASLWKLAVR